MQTIPAPPRIGHSAPCPFQLVDGLRAYGREAFNSPDPQQRKAARVALSAAGQIGVHIGGAA